MYHGPHIGCHIFHGFSFLLLSRRGSSTGSMGIENTEASLVLLTDSFIDVYGEYKKNIWENLKRRLYNKQEQSKIQNINNKLQINYAFLLSGR